jgi:hypothetical protein
MPINSYSLKPLFDKVGAKSEYRTRRTSAKDSGRLVQAKPTTNIDDDGVTSAAETQGRPDSQEVTELPLEDDVGKRREHSRSTSR